MASRQRITEFLAHGQLYITVCAGLMTWHTLRLFNLHANGQAISLFISAATLFTYSLHALLNLSGDRPSERDLWNRRNRMLTGSLSIAGVAGMIYFFMQTGIQWYILSIPAFTTVIYLFSGRISPGIHRMTGFAKTFILAFTWTFATAIMPLLSDDADMTAMQWIFVVNRFLLVYAICLLFDLRDRESDMLNGIRTLPARIPPGDLSTVFRIIMVCFHASCAAFFLGDGRLSVFILLFLPGLILSLMAPAAARVRQDMAYYLLLDGLMMLPAILHFLFIR